MRITPLPQLAGVGLHAGREPTEAEVARIMKGHPFKSSDFGVRFGACNVVHVVVSYKTGRICGI